MILRKFSYLAMVLIIGLGFQGCSDNQSVENTGDTARVQLKLVDAPGDYLEVNVNIIDVQYNSGDEGWKSFESFEGPKIVDLTELIGGVNVVLSDEVIPAGTLKQIRLILDEDGNNIVVKVDEESSLEFPLTTPSAQQSGLKLKLDAELEPGFSYTFILDWNVQESIVKTGSDKYILKPVIRVEAEANTGSIEGVVSGDMINDEVDGPVVLKDIVVVLYKADAGEEDEPYATTLTDEEGYFLFQGIPTIDYEIEIEQEGFDSYELDDITVIVDETLDIGTVVLDVPEV